MPKTPITRFLKEYSKAIDGREAAMFIGAGLSIPAGFKSWPELLRDVADELKLDIDRETDLVALAQFHFNQHKVRTRLNQLLVDEYAQYFPVTENHRLIASLPIETVWTTNYECLIERAFREAGKRCEAKVTPENFSITLRGKDITVYKMHGDVTQPQDTVLIKEDYELYNVHREVFTNALKGDLVNKTFLFLGFSFTDPNIDYVLSRIRVLMGHNPRQHYCIMKWPSSPEESGKNRADYDYEMRRLELRIGDMRRYGIEALVVHDYAEITDVLQALNKMAHRNSVFVSGSAHDYLPLGQDRIESLSQKIGQSLITHGLNLVTGLGTGIGGSVLIGTLQQVYAGEGASIADRIVMRPFPQIATDNPARSNLHTKYRQDMLSQVGYAIFMCGNKLNEKTGSAEAATGVEEEFSILKSLGKFPIPIGATGGVAKAIWDEVVKHPKEFYGSANVVNHLQVSGDGSRTDDEYIEALLAIIKQTNNA